VQCLDGPVPAQQVGQAGGAGHLEGQAGDRVDGHGLPPVGVQVAPLAGDLDDLGGVRKAELVDRDGFEGAVLDAAAVAGAIGDRHQVPGQAGAARQQRGLVGLDHQQVVRLLDADQELGGLGVGLQRVGGDDHPSKVQGRKQRGEGGYLLGRSTDLALGQHLAGGVVHRRQQVHRAAVTVGWVGAAQRLAVDGHRPPPAGHPTGTLLVGQPGADRAGDCVGVQAAEGAADGGLGRDGEAAGGLLAGAQGGPDRLGRIGGHRTPEPWYRRCLD
jgi:hypothetical protein